MCAEHGYDKNAQAISAKMKEINQIKSQFFLVNFSNYWKMYMNDHFFLDYLGKVVKRAIITQARALLSVITALTMLPIKQPIK